MDQKPLFPLVTYALPVQKMAVKCMNPIDAVRYSLSSPTAARIVKEAKIPIESVTVIDDREGFHLSVISPGSHTSKRYRYIVCFEESGRPGDQFPLQLITGEALAWHVVSSSCHVLVNAENKKTIINAFLNHLLTVLHTSGKEAVELYHPTSLPFIPCLFQPKRTVETVRLHGRWSVDQFRTVLNGLNVTREVDLAAVDDCKGFPLQEVTAFQITINTFCFPTKQLVNLRTPKIEMLVGKRKHFNFIVKKWASGEAFENLWNFAFHSWDQGFMDDKLYINSINCEKWDQKRRPGFLCQLGDDNVESFTDLRDAVDVFRNDGKFATIYDGFEATQCKYLQFRVWKKEELKCTAKEDASKLCQMLQKHTEEFDKSTAEVRNLEKMIEDLIETKQRWMGEAEKSEAEIDKIRKCLSGINERAV